ncbi:MAG: phage minor head protein [Desulfovibrio sp.]
MGDSPQDLLDIYWLARQIAWRYKLDAYDDEVLATIQKTVTKARREILGRFEAQLLRTDWTAARAEEVLYVLDDLTAGLRQSMADQLGDAAGFAGQYSLAEHSSILSVGGAALAVSSVEVSADQLRQMFVDTPLGGKTLAGWVDSAFDATVRAGIREELNAGVLQGEGYPKLVKRLTQGFEALSKEQAVTLTRTYVQSANVAAAEAVYKRNADVVSRVKWRSVLEPGYKKTGRGTCLRCASLDGKTWALNDESRPDCPLHARCRCQLSPMTISWRDLGIDIDELEDAARPYTIRPGKNIGAGGRREILEYGQHKGDYGSWFEKQDEAFKLNVVGPGRLALLQEGKVKFEDFVDGAGNLRTLEELQNAR